MAIQPKVEVSPMASADIVEVVKLNSFELSINPNSLFSNKNIYGLTSCKAGTSLHCKLSNRFGSPLLLVPESLDPIIRYYLVLRRL